MCYSARGWSPALEQMGLDLLWGPVGLLASDNWHHFVTHHLLRAAVLPSWLHCESLGEV